MIYRRREGKGKRKERLRRRRRNEVIYRRREGKGKRKERLKRRRNEVIYRRREGKGKGKERLRRRRRSGGRRSEGTKKYSCLWVLQYQKSNIPLLFGGAVMCTASLPLLLQHCVQDGVRDHHLLPPRSIQTLQLDHLQHL